MRFTSNQSACLLLAAAENRSQNVRNASGTRVWSKFKIKFCRSIYESFGQSKSQEKFSHLVIYSWEKDFLKVSHVVTFANQKLGCPTATVSTLDKKKNKLGSFGVCFDSCS
jgi:hypothetical protein